MTEQYRIVGIFYSKPFLYRDSSGEVTPGRIGVTLSVGMADNFGIGAKVVERIEYDKDMDAFKVYYPKGGLKVIPKSYDCEVTYELIDNAKSQNKANKKAV